MRQKQEEGNTSRCGLYFQIPTIQIWKSLPYLPHDSRGMILGTEGDLASVFEKAVTKS